MLKINFESDELMLLSLDGNWTLYKCNKFNFSKYLCVDNGTDMIFYSPDVLITFNKYICAELEVSYKLPVGWLQAKSPKGRICFLDTMNKISTWTNPIIRFILPFGWERVDSQTEGIYYHHLFLNHCQRYNPNLWTHTTYCKSYNPSEEKFLSYFKKVKNKNVEMNMLVFASLIFKKDHTFNEIKSMLYNDLLNLYEALETVIYLKIKETFIKYEKIRAEICLRMFMERPPKSIF